MSDATTNKKVAVIGSSVNGLACAWHLHVNSPSTEVSLFEKDDRLGGHNTISIQPKSSPDAMLDVDIASMVYNSSNSPDMVQWFQALGIESKWTDISVSVSLDDGRTEWSSADLSGFLAKTSLKFSPSLHRVIKDTTRFNKEAWKILSFPIDDPRRQVSVKQYLREEGYSEDFTIQFLLPIIATLWDTNMFDILEFPAQEVIGFICKHKVLHTIFDRAQVIILFVHAP